MIHVADHLWQSTLFALATAGLSHLMRKNAAAIRYWLWMAASFKFLLPFSILITLGGRISSYPAVQPVRADWLSIVEVISPPLSTAAAPAKIAAALSPPSSNLLWVLLTVVWLSGVTASLGIFLLHWYRVRKLVRRAILQGHEQGVPVLLSEALLEPGVFGIFRPCLVLPAGITSRLTPAQLSAIFAHELCHVQRRDNLFALLHMTVQSVFWFHPMVWWIGQRLIEERETACDEEVLRLGNKAETYAEGILTVCKFYLESPLLCVPGVTGAALNKRIEAIMQNSVLRPLTAARKLLLSSAACAVVVLPIALGVAQAPLALGQQAPQFPKPALVFDVASVKPANPEAQGTRIMMSPGGGLNITNAPLREIIALAYNVRNFQISGGPGWLTSERFDINAKVDGAEPPSDARRVSDAERTKEAEKTRERLRALLADRFALVVGHESKEMPAYVLTVGKGGSKLKESAPTEAGPRGMRMQRGHLSAQSSSLDMVTRVLANELSKPVIDQTGLKGTYDFELKWAPEMAAGPGAGANPGETSAASADVSGPSIFTALQEQVGLKLEAHRAPVEMIVITRAEKPSAN